MYHYAATAAWPAEVRTDICAVVDSTATLKERAIATCAELCRQTLLDGLQSAESDEFGRNIGEVMRMRREQRRYESCTTRSLYYSSATVLGSEWCSRRALRAAKRKAEPNPNPLEHEVLPRIAVGSVPSRVPQGNRNARCDLSCTRRQSCRE